MSAIPILPSHESARPTAAAITNWLMGLGWNTVVVTENFVLVKSKQSSMPTKVWTREWVASQMAGISAAHAPDGLDVILLIERIVDKAMGAAK